MEWHDEMVRQAMEIITCVVTRMKAQWEELSQSLASTMVSLALEGDQLLEVYDKTKSFCNGQGKQGNGKCI